MLLSSYFVLKIDTLNCDMSTHINLNSYSYKLASFFPHPSPIGYGKKNMNVTNRTQEFSSNYNFVIYLFFNFAPVKNNTKIFRQIYFVLKTTHRFVQRITESRYPLYDGICKFSTLKLVDRNGGTIPRPVMRL